MFIPFEVPMLAFFVYIYIFKIDYKSFDMCKILQIIDFNDQFVDQIGEQLESKTRW